MGLWIFIALQLAATVAAFVFMERRHRAMSRDLARLQSAVAAFEARELGARRSARVAKAAGAPGGAARIVAHPAVVEAPAARAARAWRLRAPRLSISATPNKVVRGLGLAIAAAAPAFAVALGVEFSVSVWCGLVIGAAMMGISLRAGWSAAAWGGVATASAWALVGATLAVPSAGTAAAMALAGLAGLAHAQLRKITPGATMAGAMAAVMLALAAQSGAIGDASLGFATIVTAAALLGALSARLEALHVSAFAAAIAGLFVMSGQAQAAIWFTPIAAWTGAIFFGIAAVRVPQLGAEGAVTAGTGVLAPLLAIGALHGARHGLPDPPAAAAAFLLAALLFAGLLALTVRRAELGLAGLRLTPWVLGFGAFAALASALALIAPAPFAAPAFAVLTLALALVRGRAPHAVWSGLTVASTAAVALNAYAAARMLMVEAHGWSPGVILASGLILPALLVAAAARRAERDGAHAASGFAACAAFALGVGAANLMVRVLFSNGATLLHPMSFVEVGAHISVWLAASLLAAASAQRNSMRSGAAALMGLMAVLASVISASLWLGPFWATREAEAGLHAPLGFLGPAIFFWAHWALWRSRSSNLPTRTAFAAAALSSAAFVASEVLRAGGGGDWVSAGICAAVFALAVAINFAAGVTAPRALPAKASAR